MSIDNKCKVRNKRIVDCRTKFRKKSKTAYRYFQEFSDATTLHGIRYIGEPNRHVIEKLFWGIAVVVCTVWCGIQIEQLWTRWKTSPVIVTLAERSTKIWNIPFPAITICPENKIRRSRLDIEIEMSRKNSERNKSLHDDFDWQTASLVCNKINTDFFLELLSDQYNYSFIPHWDHSHLLKLYELSPELEDVFCDCFWGVDERECSQVFRPTMTDQGVCFTFNMLESSDLFTSEVNLATPVNWTWIKQNSTWNADSGYSKEVAIVESYPLRAVSNGHDSGLSMLLRVKPDDMQPHCSGDAQSFKLMVHAVSEFPQVSSQFVHLPLDSTVSVSVRPDMVTTASSLKAHEPKVRGCYFPDERKLKYFKVYTQQNCEIECLIEPIFDMCDCQLMYLPIVEYRGYSFCSQDHAPCIRKLDEQVQHILATITEELGTVDPHCSCLPSCSEHRYQLQMSTSQFNISNDLRKDVNTTKYRYIELSVYFKDMQFIHSHRSELYSTLDFLANCGGLLGLFTGFSITSAIEICYFLSLRLICNLNTHRQNKRRKSSASSNDDIE